MSDPQDEVAIRVRDLVTHYGDREILHGIDMDVRRGEIMVIMGGSGSGKTTLLRHLLGLEKATSGSIQLLGHELTELDEAGLYEVSKKIGVAFQGGALFSSMVEHNPQLARSTMEIQMRMKLETVKLSGFEDLKPSELSGGMIKRAAFARAVVMDPAILFADEPSAGLDPVVSRALDQLILQLRDALRMTIVVVTQ